MSVHAFKMRRQIFMDGQPPICGCLILDEAYYIECTCLTPDMPKTIIKDWLEGLP